MSEPSLTQVLEQLTALQTQLATLNARLEKIEQQNAASPAPVAGPAATPAPEPEAIPEEVVIAIAAAVAAFLGKKAPIRQIRLLGSTAWAQQGRAYIQASHVLSVQHN